MIKTDKPLAWPHGEIKTPPFSSQARIEAGYLLRQLQMGDKLSLPHSRPMSAIGKRCHELRIDSDAILILEVFEKKTQNTPKSVIDACRRRMQLYQL